MNKFSFKIQDKIFDLPADFVSAGSFTVQSAPRSYEVILNEGGSAAIFIQGLLDTNSKNLLLIDKSIFDLLKSSVSWSLDRVFIVEAIEEAKTLEGCMRVVDFLIKRQFSKAENLIVVGGGIIQDIGAFVGAVFKRGIPWIYVPTTLLAMSDSCIGGKTGINYNHVKNQLALFSAPRQVVIHPGFLKTLHQREFHSGLGEIFKLHVTGGLDMIKKYEKYVTSGRVSHFADYSSLIMESLAIKRLVIERDEFELDLRRSMNYGHTFGHAIESMSEYQIPHGQAVAIGMLIANEISARRDMLSQEEKQHLRRLTFDLLDDSVWTVMHSLDLDSLMELLKKDKKTLGSRVTLVVLKKIGEMIFLSLPHDNQLYEEVRVIIKDLFATKP